MLLDDKEIVVRFSYHSPNPEQFELYEDIRAFARRYAQLLTNFCPESRELSLAITKLEEVVFWANAAIARRSQQQ